jgi:two-component system, OmpR family, sensor histidine kinase BaeS
MRSIRTRLIFTHILPVMITVPLMGLALVYILQTQILLANLSNALQAQAVLLVEMTSEQVDIWTNPETAQAFVTRISSQIDAQLMLVGAHGNLLAASDPAQTSNIGKVVNLEGLTDALEGKSSTVVQYNPVANNDAINMVMPVIDQNHQVIGVIRLNLPVKSLQDKISGMRTMILWIMGGGLLLGAILGWGLALSIERPLRRTTTAIQNYSHGQNLDSLTEQGPTELRSLIRAFNTLAERLKNLEEGRRRLLANLVHELGRPLGAMYSAIQALQGGADRNKALRRELLDGIGGEIKRLENLLNDLTHLYDQGVGPLELNLQNVDCTDWLTGILSSWRESALAKDLHWHVEIPANLNVIKIDPDRMAQAVGNLISNDIKYTPPEGLVDVKVARQNGSLLIRVKDSGPGIEKDEHEMIFTPFYRGRASKRFPQGMGLGLSIARDLVLAHQGSITVESQPGEGSTFTIQIPVI